MNNTPSLSNSFDKAAGTGETGFAVYLRQTFGTETARNVLDAFDKMGLAAPQDANEFITGTAGSLVFMNRYGLVMRIEYKDTHKVADPRFWFDRVNNNPWVLKPLASLDAGEAIIELCPGTYPSADRMASYELEHRLRQEGVSYWDEEVENIGRIPLRTPRFPEGLTVVIDRGAVNFLMQGISSVKDALDREQVQETADAKAALREFYGPLRDSLVAGWREPEKMPLFWAMCEQYVRDGKLVDGWNKNDEKEYVPQKKQGAAAAAEAYERRLRLSDKVSAPGAVVPSKLGI